MRTQALDVLAQRQLSLTGLSNGIRNSNMPGVLRHAFRLLTAAENQVAVRYMSDGVKQLEGGRKPHVCILYDFVHDVGLTEVLAS